MSAKFELKLIQKAAIPAALQKAERYRLLNEPGQAESICLDVLQADSENEQALVSLLLALTDQFPRRLGIAVRQARELLPRLRDAYDQAYYAGVICERKALTEMQRGGPGSGTEAYEDFREAMRHYEEAERKRPAGNDDA